MAGITCFVIIAPWSIYLSLRFDRPVLLNGSGDAIAAGNNVITYHGTFLGYYDTKLRYIFKVPHTNSPIVFESRERQIALDFMQSELGHVPVVMAARVGRTFGFFRPFQQMHLETERGSPLWEYQIAFFAYWVLLPFAFAGGVIARRRRIPIYPLLVFPLLSVLSVMLTIGSVRYRAPAEIPLVLLAAFAIDAALGRWRAAKEGTRRDSAREPVRAPRRSAAVRVVERTMPPEPRSLTVWLVDPRASSEGCPER